MAKCDGKTEEHKVDVKEGKYDSDPFDKGDGWEKGNAIKDFLKKFQPNKKVCEASCTGGNEDCQAKNLKADVPKGSGTFKRVKVDGSDYIYYLKITDDCKVKFTVECNCVPYPD
jgi:hypothetical protein